jgi:hypothetical protein
MIRLEYASVVKSHQQAGSDENQYGADADNVVNQVQLGFHQSVQPECVMAGQYSKRIDRSATQGWIRICWLQLVAGVYIGGEGSASPLLDQHIKSVILVVDFLCYLALFVLLCTNRKAPF